MLSTCPSCLNQILHEDGVDQLTCDCGERFSPFLMPPPSMELPTSTPLMAMGEQHTFGGKPLTEIASESQVSAPAGEHDFSDFSESEAAFAELRNYGETLVPFDSSSQSSTTEEPPPKAHTPAPSVAPVTQTTPSPTHSSGASCPITAGDHLEGHQIVSFLPPLSIWCPASVEVEDPLQKSHEILSQKAGLLGANGVVSVRWSFTPDGTRILMTGTPVKCLKQG